MFNVVWRGRWLVVLAALVFAFVAAVAVSRLEPLYKATATVMFGGQRASIADVQDFLIERPFRSGDLVNEIQILNSTSLLARVVRELELQKDPFFNPDATRDDGRGWLSRLLGLGASQDALDPAVVEDEGVANAVDRIREDMKLMPVADSTVIMIEFEAPTPDAASSVVGAVVEQYVIDRMQARLETARAATEWLTARVEELRQKVESSEEAVENLRSQLSASAGQGLEITQQQLAALTQELSNARGAAAGAEARFSRLSEAMAAGKDVGSESQMIQSYRVEEGALLARRQTLSGNHPAISQLDMQIAAVRARIQDETRRVVAAAEEVLETAVARVTELERTVRDLESRALAQSRDEIRIRQLEREAQANRLLYESLLSRLTQASEQVGLQGTDARVLSPAQRPTEPVSRHAAQFALVSGLVGALAMIGYIIVRDNLRNTFRTPRQIEGMTGLNVLAVLPSVHTRDRDFVRHLIEKPSSSLAEAVRNLRTSILLPNAQKPPKVVMFTSSVPGEGKSTTSVLTAVTSRNMGKSTVIVDCDLRLSVIERMLRVEDDRPGLLSVLGGTASVREAMYEDPVTGLNVLMVRDRERAEKSGASAADILASQRFANLVRELSQLYDVVVLDTPPALVVTDARIVSSLADAVVYVVRWDKTPRDAVIEGIRELRSVNAPLAGAVLTMLDEKRAASSVVEGYTHHRARHRAYFEA